MRRLFAAAASVPASCLAGMARADAQATILPGVQAPVSPYWMWATLVVGVALLVTIALLLRMRDRHRLLEQALDRTSDAAFILGDKGFIYVNEAACLSLGYSRDELLHMCVFDIDPDVDQAMLAEIRQKNSVGGRVIFETRHRRRDGSIFPVEIAATHFLHKNETLSICMVRDITERKLAGQALRANEEKIRSLYELSPLGIALTDMQGRYIEFNEAFRAICGYPTDELMTLDYWTLTPEKYKEDEAWQLDSLARSGRYGPYEKEYRQKDGTLVPIQLNGVLVTGKDGKQYIWSIVEDITERKQAQRELAESRAQLRGLVVQREMAREEERKFIAREIHDELGQILTGLKMSISVIGQDWPAAVAPVSGYIKESMALTETAIGVVRNISAAIRPAELDMGIVAALRWQANRFDTFAGIPCEVRIEDEDIRLDETDAVAVFRIVQESLTNVVKHARASRVSITLAREGEGYFLEIADDGCGFDTGIRKRGSFGLVGMRERVLMLGGELAIDSDEGGTRIAVRFAGQGREKSND